MSAAYAIDGLVESESGAVRVAPSVLSIRDFVVGTVIALVMISFFTLVSSGRSLIVTFVPGVAMAWVVFFVIFARKIALPSADRFLPLFFVALAVQFLHFAEEYNTGFATLFPELYGGAAYNPGFFVAFNMVSYAAFTLCALLVFYRGVGFLLVPVLFYVVYGAIGNAITHTWWVAYSRDYFPGLFTAQLYWMVGPWLLVRLLGSRNLSLVAIVSLTAVLVTTVTAFMAN